MPSQERLHRIVRRRLGSPPTPAEQRETRRLELLLRLERWAMLHLCRAIRATKAAIERRS